MLQTYFQPNNPITLLSYSDDTVLMVSAAVHSPQSVPHLLGIPCGHTQYNG